MTKHEYISCTYIIFTKISVELQIRSNRVFRGFLFTYSPLSSSVFIWNSGNQKLGLYYIHVWCIRNTYINHVPNTSLIHVHIIHKTRPSNPSADFNSSSQRDACSFLENIDDMYTSLPLKRIIHPNMSITVGFLHGPHTRCDMCQFYF